MSELSKRSNRRGKRRGPGVERHVASTLITLTRYTAIHRWIVVIHGHPRIGKSFALKALEGMIELGRPAVLRVQHASHTQQTVLRGLCVSCGLPPSGRACDLYSRVATHLSETKRTLIIDDCDRMTSGALEVVRDLWDETGCPVLFVGNGDVRRVRGVSEQFVTRVGISWHLEPLEDDDEWLSSAHGVRKLLDVPKLRFVPDMPD